MDAHPDIVQKVAAAEQEKIREKSDKDKDKDKVQEDDMSVTNMYHSFFFCLQKCWHASAKNHFKSIWFSYLFPVKFWNSKKSKIRSTCNLNPLTPMSDQDRISPYN